MAPNNALTEKKSMATVPKSRQGSTTVLEAGTVEARGTGFEKPSQVIQAEIQEFLDGEGKFSIYAESRAFFTVFTFITRLPGPTWTDHHPGFLMKGMAYFPVAGFLVGIFVGVFFDFANIIMGLPLVASAVISTAASLWVTGCFHEDGLADSSDGIGGGWSRKQILTIMTDTRLGTYGCAVLVLYMAAKLHLLAAQGPTLFDGIGSCQGAAPALLVSHSVARSVAPYMVRTRDYVDETGPKYKFYMFMVNAKHLVTWPRVSVALGFSSVVVATLYGPLVSLILMSLVVIQGHLAGAYGEYLLGGVMGDYLGATICVTEILCLSVLHMASSYGLQDLTTVESIFRKLSEINTSWSEILDLSSQTGVLTRFVLVVAATSVWSSCVGHPSVLVRDTVSKTQDEANGDENVSISFQDKPLQKAEDSARSKTESSLSRNGATFMERYEAARCFLDALAKPVGSLGSLEEWVAKVAALQCKTRIQVDPVACVIFAGDHGAAKSPESGGSGCSAYPQSVTRSILQGFQMGIAGASVLAKESGAKLFVVDVGVAGEGYAGDIVYSSENKLIGGTRNVCLGAAMTLEDAKKCLEAGRKEIMDVIVNTQAHVIVLGEVGIGNTTSSSALIALLTSASAESVCGGGATTSREASSEAIEKKIGLVKQAIAKNTSGSFPSNPMEALALAGGAEIVAMVGAFLQCSERNIPVLCDGFIVSTAAMVAVLMEPSVCRILLLATASAEPGHEIAVNKIREVAKANDIPMALPALSMGLRMGEGTAGLLAVPILRGAAAVAQKMGTIEDILGK